MRELKDMKMLHPGTRSELAEVPVYYPFEWNGRMLRCVPVKNKSVSPCRNCYWEKHRDRSLRCMMADACMAAYRRDRESVKFISNELSSLNMDKETSERARLIDKICYKDEDGN